MEWTTTKPTEPCVFVAASETRVGWQHDVYEIRWVDDGEESYLVLFNNMDEWGDLADLTADKYLILPKH